MITDLKRDGGILTALGLTLLAGLILSLVMGEGGTDVSLIRAALSGQDSLSQEILFQIRLPRALTAALVGALLGLSGAVLQGLLRNPLADPGVLGISSAAGLGAALAIVLGFSLVPGVTEGFALCFALGFALLLSLYTLRHPEPEALILFGVAASSLGGALTALVYNLSPSPLAMA
ncbi:MAG: iron chelate uptake ABC transporter family permease subunit, partial [Asticcacaulis sp.]